MADPKIDFRFFDSIKNNMVTLLSVPMVLIGIINILYGEYFDTIIGLKGLDPNSIFELHNQLNFFKNYVSLSTGSLPLVVREIGYYSVVLIYVFLIVWVVVFTISNYLNLTNRKGSKILMLLELLAMVLVFTFLIKPGMGMLYSMLGYLVFLVLFGVLLLYWVEGIRNKQ